MSLKSVVAERVAKAHFEARGNHSEAHLTQLEVVALIKLSITVYETALNVEAQIAIERACQQIASSTSKKAGVQ